MAESSLLTLGALSCFLGVSWWALSLQVHWRQIRVKSDAPVIMLRSLALAALSSALLFCLMADHGSIAILVWFMAVAGSALSVALLLAWRPAWLGTLVIWLPGH